MSHHEIDVPGNEVLHHERTAAIRYELKTGSGGVLDGQTADMPAAAETDDAG